jgi:hypothetical protein
LERLKAHQIFVIKRTAEKSPLKYSNEFFGFPVMTAQEQKMKLVFLDKVEELGENHYRAFYLNDEKARKFAAGTPHQEFYEELTHTQQKFIPEEGIVWKNP